MNDAWGYDENDPNGSNENLGNGPKPLRDAYVAQKKANEDLMKRLEQLEAVNNRNQVADLFESQGVPRGAAQYYSGAPDTEKVSAFINDMRSAFGAASQAQAATTAAAPTIDPNDAAKLQGLMQAGSNSEPAGNYDTALAVLNNPASSRDDRIAALAAFNRMNQQ